ncbi:sensor histidine kinase [Allomuricauda sp. SCSIO 65647]|uniref:sensor histidine kinase n=1 Tax=Allomuricauda sp. SCSIO 65647 TaxID=2908843 RepID=UPI001F3B0389|nr:sensor histidine kinase [Muricauda sp. SCSIO 65647]UJH66664.1 sensor histidine kinase [Muricauda sp. SCSIO 65647]
MVLLCDVLVDKNEVIIDSTKIIGKSKEIEKALGHLIIGYSRIYGNEQNGLAAFKNFVEVLEIGDRLEKKYISKAALIALLELFKKEVFIGSAQYQYYLDRLKLLSNDLPDEVIYALYETIFMSKGKQDLKESQGYSESFLKLDKIVQRLPSNNKLLVKYYYEKAIYGKINKDYGSALSNFRKVHSLANNVDQFEALNCVVNWQISDTYLLIRKLDSALFYIKKSENCAKSVKDNFYDLRLKSEIMAAYEDFEEAYTSLRASLDLEYSLEYKNNTLESSIETVKNKTEKLQLDNITLENQKNRMWYALGFLGVILVLGSGIAILLQKNTTKKRLLAEQEALLRQQKVENLLKEQELVSIDAMIAGQEKERQKVAGELHDDLGSLMATIKLHFDNAKVGKKDPALQNAQKLLEEAYIKIRGMAHSKNSGVMSDQGLLTAIKKMAQTITETNALEVKVEDFGMGERLENTLELSIFRMVQELVANAIKHADATKVNIQLTQHEDTLNIIVEDNGKGFDRSKLDTNHSGMGLTNTEKRVEHLGGGFTIDSIVGKGTSILIDIPI